MLGRISLVAAAFLALALFATVGRVVFHELLGGAASVGAQIEERMGALAAEIQPTLPLQIDEVTKLAGVEGIDRSFYYYYTLQLSREQVGEDAVRQVVQDSIPSLCADEQKAWLSDNGVTFVFAYIDVSGTPFIEVPVEPGSCQG